jgi:transposase InsO family protein
MPWSEGRVDERKRLIELWETGSTPTELSERFRVSRVTVYSVIARWLSEEGAARLEDRSRRPHSNSRQTKASVSAALLNVKDQHPDYGPDKLVRLLRDDGIVLAAGTANDILKRNGRVQARRARPPRWSPSVTPTISVPGPGHSMSADHKGQFRMGSGRYCYPLTIADPASRYVFAVDALSSTSVSSAMVVFERVFREWGLPEQIITDNGNPFCSARSLGGLTELSKMWIKLGIQQVRIQPGRPQQNGIHERMHRTLKKHATQPPEPNLRAQQRRFDTFLAEFNHVRPHQALGQSALSPGSHAIVDSIPNRSLRSSTRACSRCAWSETAASSSGRVSCCSSARSFVGSASPCSRLRTISGGSSLVPFTWPPGMLTPSASPPLCRQVQTASQDRRPPR